MLAVEQDPVEARAGDHLDAVIRRQARPEADLRLVRLERALERVLGQVHQSNFTPDSLTTFAHFACSLASHVPKLSGVPARTSVPSLARRSFMSAVLSTRISSPFSLTTIS